LPVRFQTDLPREDERIALQHAIEDVLADRDGTWFVSVTEPQHSPEWHVRVEGPGVSLSEVFLGPDEQQPTYIAAAIRSVLAAEPMVLRTFTIIGFGPFANTTIPLDSLAVFVGANGTGKTSLLELLRAIREFIRTEIPPEIIPGWETREVYHRPGPDGLGWRLWFQVGSDDYRFAAHVVGVRGTPVVAEEIVEVRTAQGHELAALRRRGRHVAMLSLGEERFIGTAQPNQLALRTYINPTERRLNRLKDEIDSWRFFSGIRFNDRQIRQPALIEESPALRDDGSNLASVLHWLQIAHGDIFRELELQIRGIIPAFRALAVKPAGAGRVTLTWEEEGFVNPLTAADLSDGSLRLLLWLTLALVPNPPALVCIDEPEVGMHPRTLPKIAGLLKKLSRRTQVLLTTHSSYLLAQFDVSSVAVLRKRNGSIEFTKPGDSAALLENLREFGAEELELMHRSDELEALT